MSCACKNKEYHPCQHGGKCQCGGKCKQNGFLNAAGQYDEHHFNITGLEDFRDETKNSAKLIFYVLGAAFLITLGIGMYKEINK